MEILEFVKFVEERNAGFSSRIMPADKDLIEDIVASTKHPLPELYLEFLRAMGHELAEFVVPKMSFDPMDVANSVASNSSPQPDRFSVFALNVPDPGGLHMHWSPRLPALIAVTQPSGDKGIPWVGCSRAAELGR